MHYNTLLYSFERCVYKYHTVTNNHKSRLNIYSHSVSLWILLSVLIQNLNSYDLYFDSIEQKLLCLIRFSYLSVRSVIRLYGFFYRFFTVTLLFIENLTVLVFLMKETSQIEVERESYLRIIWIKDESFPKIDTIFISTKFIGSELRPN